MTQNAERLLGCQSQKATVKNETVLIKNIAGQRWHYFNLHCRFLQASSFPPSFSLRGNG